MVIVLVSASDPNCPPALCNRLSTCCHKTCSMLARWTMHEVICLCSVNQTGRGGGCEWLTFTLGLEELGFHYFNFKHFICVKAISYTVIIGMLSKFLDKTLPQLKMTSNLLHVCSLCPAVGMQSQSWLKNEGNAARLFVLHSDWKPCLLMCLRKSSHYLLISLWHTSIDYDFFQSSFSFLTLKSAQETFYFETFWSSCGFRPQILLF